jgi:polar amino acid transport system substrate-binding protein
MKIPPSPKRRPFYVLVLLALVTVLAVAGCGSGSSSSPRQVLEARPVGGGLTPLGLQLPDKIRNAREVRVGADISYAPVEFYDALAPDVLDRPSGEPDPGIQGIDPDLANELGRKLGVRFTFVNVKFDSLIDSLRNGNIDAIISGMSATPDRASQVSFIEYFQAGTSILVPKGNPKGISSMADLCGKTVTVQAATTQDDLAKADESKCPPGQPMRVQQFDSGSQSLLEVKYGHADASLTDFPVAAYNAKVSDAGRDFEVVGQQIDPGPFGIGVRKADAPLREALRTALRQIIADGSYDRVLAKWNVGDGALKTAQVIGAPTIN